MLKIRSLQAALATTKVTIDGVEYTVRALSAADTDRIMAVCPEPEPKTRMPDPNGGSLATPIPDRNEPGFAALMDAHHRKVRKLQVAVALDGVPDGFAAWGSTGQSDKAWADKAVEELSVTLTDYQIGTVWSALMGLLDQSRVRRALITEVEGVETADDVAARFKLPERYGIGDAGLFLRICERYGESPFAAVGVSYDDPTMWRLLREQERIRMAEEDRARAEALV